jgi:diguanylate cyclase (GGDEF)-like protein/PAS domain S-box-containing protein
VAGARGEERRRASGSPGVGVDRYLDAHLVVPIFGPDRIRGDIDAARRSTFGSVGSGDDSVGAEDLTVEMARDTAAVITWVGEGIVELLGWRPDQLVGLPSTRFIHPEDQPSAVSAWVSMITTPGTPQVWRGRYQDGHGVWTWIEAVNVLDDPDKGIVSTKMRRIAFEQAGLEEELRQREQLLSRLSEALPVGVFQIDLTGNITFTNDRLHRVVGKVPAATIEAQLSNVLADDRPVLEAALAATLAGEPVDDIEVRLVLSPGDPPLGDPERVCMLSMRALTDGAGVVSGAVGCVSDVTERARLRRELETKATVDELTSCLNRAATLEMVERVTATPLAGSGTALIFLDLDRFKSVNDRFGHAAGDHVLVEAAERLRGAVRDGDHVGRLGGDEFLVICPRVQSAEQAVMIAERIKRAITATVDVGTGVVELEASLGVVWTTEAIDADTLVAQADERMYESKRTGGAGVSMLT